MPEWKTMDSLTGEDQSVLVWMEEPLLGSHIHVMTIRNKIKILAGNFAFDHPDPLYWMPTHFIPKPKEVK